MNFESIMQSEMSQMYDFTHMWDIQQEATNKRSQSLLSN